MFLKLKEKTFEGIDIGKFFLPSDKETCSRKRRFVTAVEAYLVRDRKFPHLNVYFCNICQGWHLGHRIGWLKMKAEEENLILKNIPTVSNKSFHKNFKLIRIRKKRLRDFARKSERIMENADN
jgi:hypothetical protein